MENVKIGDILKVKDDVLIVKIEIIAVSEEIRNKLQLKSDEIAIIKQVKGSIIDKIEVEATNIFLCSDSDSINNCDSINNYYLIPESKFSINTIEQMKKDKK